MEPLLQVLAAADSTVREGLNAQVQALAEERAALDAEWAQLAADRARVDEGRCAVDDMVRVGRKMRQTQLAKIQNPSVRGSTGLRHAGGGRGAAGGTDRLERLG